MTSTIQKVALNRIEAATARLAIALDCTYDAKGIRNSLKAFMEDALKNVADIGEEVEADPLVMVHSLDYVRECIDDGFVDAIDAEERSEPRIDPVRHYSTYSTIGGRVA